MILQICRTGHDTVSCIRMTTLILYFLSYLPLMVKATMLSVLNTIRNIFMRLYDSVEEVVTIGLVYKIWRLLCSYPPSAKFFLDLDSLSIFTYYRAQIRFVGLVL